MRITNSMMISNTVWNLNKNTERMEKARQKMATQSKIKLPSDDPVAATRAIKYRNYISQTKQYQDNIADALSWQDITENALSNLGDVVKQVRDFTVQASNGSMTDEDRRQIKQQVAQLKEQALQILNTTYTGRYVFGGYTTDQPPYELKTVTVDGQQIEKILYKGGYINLEGLVASTLSDTKISDLYTASVSQIYHNNGKEEIKYNIGYGNQITVNLEGHEIVGESAGNNLFDTFDKLLLGLDGATEYKTMQIDNSTSPVTINIKTHNLELSGILEELDRDMERILSARADLGARMNYLEITKDRLGTDYITYTELKSNNEDVDVAEASTELSTAEYVYEASLAVGSKVMKKSLVDFLT